MLIPFYTLQNMNNSKINKPGESLKTDSFGKFLHSKLFLQQHKTPATNLHNIFSLCYFRALTWMILSPF